MAKEKDFISEEEFNRRARSVSRSPQRDSPGDSDRDLQAEIEMGFDFEPDEDDEQLEADEPEFDKSGIDDRAKFVHKDAPDEDDIPASAKAVSSDLPAPRLDRDKKSSTH
jgi:hypothetical protein